MWKEDVTGCHHVSGAEIGSIVMCGRASLARTREQEWEYVRHSVSRVGPLNEGRYLGFGDGA